MLEKSFLLSAIVLHYSSIDYVNGYLLTTLKDEQLWKLYLVLVDETILSNIYSDIPCFVKPSSSSTINSSKVSSLLLPPPVLPLPKFFLWNKVIQNISRYFEIMDKYDLGLTWSVTKIWPGYNLDMTWTTDNVPASLKATLDQKPHLNRSRRN